jgi:hypothetical protein
MNSTQHAVVEVSAEEIMLRVGSRWLKFTQDALQDSEAGTKPFALTEDGSVRLDDGPPEEMDFAAERLAREVLHNG